jgi:hypothetical protein
MYFRVTLSILLALIFSVFVMWFQNSTLLCDSLWRCIITWSSNNNLYDSYTLCMPDSSWKIYKCLGPRQCCNKCQNFQIANNKSTNNINIAFKISHSIDIYTKVCFGSCVLICIFVSIFYVNISHHKKQKCISSQERSVQSDDSFKKKLSVFMFLLCLCFLINNIVLLGLGILKLWKRYQSLKRCQIELFHIMTWIITYLVISIFLITIILKNKFCLKFFFSFLSTLHILWSIFLIIYLEGVYHGRWLIYLP